MRAKVGNRAKNRYTIIAKGASSVGLFISNRKMHKSSTQIQSLNRVICNGKVYNLKFPIDAKMAFEDGYFIITSELLDIVGTGLTQEEAKENFNQEFDFIYTRYNELSDDSLSNRILNIKKILQSIVDPNKTYART